MPEILGVNERVLAIVTAQKKTEEPGMSRLFQGMKELEAVPWAQI